MEVDGTTSNDASLAPTLRFPLETTVAPGDRLGTVRQDLVPSTGTYVQGGHLYASVVGTLRLEEPVVVPNKGRACYPVRVVASTPERMEKQLIQVGHVVLGRVVRLSIPQAFVEILAGQECADLDTNRSTPLGEGILRREDVRAGATEQVRIQEMFQPGDLVLARVLALDRRYLLGTAEPSLGVIRAYSRISHQLMVPLSWKEMQCPVTGQKELRKCAKPPKQFLDDSASAEEEALVEE